MLEEGEAVNIGWSSRIYIDRATHNESMTIGSHSTEGGFVYVSPIYIYLVWCLGLVGAWEAWF